MYISFYKSVKNKNSTIINLDKFLNDVKQGTYNKEINEIRRLKQSGEDYYEIKKKLPAVALCGTFKGSRNNDNILDYSGIICLDYDKISNEQVNEFKDTFKTLKTTYACFISPSGKGLKVIIKTEGKSDEHLSYFKSIKDLYDSCVGFKSDDSAKDLARLCFVSSDPDIFINSNPENYYFMTNTDLYSIWEFTSNIIDFTSGNRNNFIYTFANNCNNAGCDMNEVINYSTQKSESDFKESEIIATVESAFKNTPQVARSANSANSATIPEDNYNTPFIDDLVYEQLPELMGKYCSHFKGRERDVFLLSLITVSSGYFSNVKFVYNGKTAYPNLCFFAVAPAGSGKSSLIHPKTLFDDYHKQLRRESEDELKKYKSAMASYNKAIKSGNNMEKPKEPKSLMFFFPGDTSSSSLIKHLEDNNGTGCIVESEADTIVGAMSNEWGSYSDLLRKNFHHETISKSRKTDLELREVDCPRMSISLSGTPKQVGRLFKTSEDGLFSRFMFYSFTSTIKWNVDYSQKVEDSKDTIFKNYASEIGDIISNENEVIFMLTEEQLDNHKDFFDTQLEKRKEHPIDNFDSIVYRHGLILFKIAAVLSSYRIPNNGNLICSDSDFESAISITDVLLNHTMVELGKINNKKSKLLIYREDLFTKLPEEFKRKEALEILSLKPRMIDNYLKRWTDDKILEKIRAGVYKKV